MVKKSLADAGRFGVAPTFLAEILAVKRFASILLLAAGVVLSSLNPCFADNWTTWRGPDVAGVVKEKGAPSVWGDNKNILWKATLPGIGGATPIVWNDRIFVTSGEGSDQVLLCFDTKGKELWKRTVGTGGRGKIRGDEGNEASASPTTDGKNIYVFVGTGILAAFDFEGKQVWSKDIQKDYGRFAIQHGLHTSPLLHGDNLYLALLHGNGNLVVALDKNTGKEVWKVNRKSDAQGESKEAYSSPILWNDTVVILGADYATGHNLKDGSEVWRLGDLNPKDKYSSALRIIASPVASPDLLVVPTARGGLIVGVKPGAKGFIGAGSEHEQWRRAKGAPDVPSPLLYNGLLYLCRENGVLQVWDAKSGDELYQERMHADRYRASPIVADGKIYCVSRDGTFTIVKAGPKFELLATNNLSDVFTASPVVANGRMYLRGFNTLYAIAEK